MTLNGRVALVTGATSGIGLGIATALAEAGAAVMLNGFAAAAQVAALRADLAARGAPATGYCGADVAHPHEIAAMVAQTCSELGRIDILVNNAGIQHTAPIADFPDEKWDAILAINLSAAFHATKAVIPGMKSRGFGRIINIASAHGLVASANKAAYVAAKHGLMGLTKVTAIELAPHGITCNAICPGWVLTPLVQAQLDARCQAEGISAEEARRLLLGEKQAMITFTTPAQIGKLALFLASDDAATMTGVPLSIDGGWTAQ